MEILGQKRPQFLSKSGYRFRVGAIGSEYKTDT